MTGWLARAGLMAAADVAVGTALPGCFELGVKLGAVAGAFAAPVAGALAAPVAGAFAAPVAGAFAAAVAGGVTAAEAVCADALVPLAGADAAAFEPA